MIDDEELVSRPSYRGARTPSDRAGENPDAPTQIPPSPPMAVAERRIACPTAPKSVGGKRICWTYNSHLGCNNNTCPIGHVFYKNYERLTTAVKIALTERYGFKKLNKLGENMEGVGVIRELLEKQHGDINSRMVPPAARGDRNPKIAPTIRVSGASPQNPPDLDCIDYLDSVGGKWDLSATGAHLVGVPLPQDEGGRTGAKRNLITTDAPGENLVATVDLLKQLDGEPKLKFLDEDPTPPASLFVCRGYGDAFVSRGENRCGDKRI